MANAVTPGIDPYIDWVWGLGRRYYFLPRRQDEGDERITILLRLKETTAHDFARGEGLGIPRRLQRQWRDSFHFLSGDPKCPGAINREPTVIALPTREIFDKLVSPRLRPKIESMTLGRPLDKKSLPPVKGRPTAKPKLQTRARKRAFRKAAPLPVVMGVIDDGIAFANERFRIFGGPNAGTRVEYWWLQDGPFQATGAVPYGYELRKADINTLLVQSSNGAVVDEEIFYRKAALLDYRHGDHKSAAWRASHGTHVMDLACGFDPREQCNDRPIVCVQLPTATTADTSGGSLFPYAYHAMRYIVSCAKAIALDRGYASLPVVINLSYGLLAGPHDGTDAIELSIKQLIIDCENEGFPLRVVLPAGNSYLGRIHAQLSFQSVDDVEELQWRVRPDDRTPSYLEIWMAKPAAGAPTSRITVTITAPTGQQHTIKENDPPLTLASGAQVYGRASYAISAPSDRRSFVIMLLPTGSLNPVAPIAPAGTWKVRLRHTGGLAKTDLVHAYVQRDDSLYGFPFRGRQSLLDDSNYVRFDPAGRDNETDDAAANVKRMGTINSIATGVSPTDFPEASPIVIGGYLQKETVAAKYSAAGSESPPPRRPDAMTGSEDSRVHSGVFAAGTRSGSVVAVGGTSIAAPQIARRIALDLANGGPGGHATVQGWATTDELTFLTQQPLAERSGAGRIKPLSITKLKRFE